MHQESPHAWPVLQVEKTLLLPLFSELVTELAVWLEISLISVTCTDNLQNNLWKLLAVIWDGQWLFGGFLVSGSGGFPLFAPVWNPVERAVVPVSLTLLMCHAVY